MSRTNNQPTNNVSRTPLNPANLAKVPPVNANAIGLGKAILTPPHQEPYYLPARISTRDTHTTRLEDQIAKIEDLMKQRN